MFTLNFPIVLPDEHFFFDDGQYPVPPLPGGLSIGCIHNEDGPIVLRVSGFEASQDAIDFCPRLRNVLRLAALDSDHSISPSRAQAVMSQGKPFNGNVPTVTPTNENLLPYHASISQKHALQISVLAKRLGTALSQRATGGPNMTQSLALALELHSDCQFAGETSAIDGVVSGAPSSKCSSPVASFCGTSNFLELRLQNRPTRHSAEHA